jgi:predicted RNA-binding protein with PUA-like domain
MLTQRHWRELIQAVASKDAAAFHLPIEEWNLKHYWLMKSEPSEVSIDDLVKQKSTGWFGVRNYQARNYMRDQMQIGDGVLFYHSSCDEPGIAGLAEVSSAPYPDPTQFDKKSHYFDPKATKETPRWMQVDVKIVKKTRLINLPELRATEQLAEMLILKKGNRLSITPVTEAEWRTIQKMLG